jgi:hypothetical protein
MRGAARQPQDDQEPAPERADLDAGAAAALDGLAGLVSRAQDLLARCPDPQSAPLLRELVTEVTLAGIHCEELRGQMAAYVAANAGNDRIFAALLARERAQAAKAAVPGPRHARSSRRQPGEGQAALFSVRLSAFAGAAVVALKPLLKHAGTALKHPAAVRLTAHTVKMAAAAAAVPAAGALVIAGAVVITTHPSPGGSPVGPGASVPGWQTSATPIPSSSLIARTVVHPKAKRGSKGKTLLDASGAYQPPPPYVPGPQPSASSSSPSSPSSASSAPAGPAVLTVSTTAIDLSGASTSAVITLSATGTGWVSWKVDTWDAATGVNQADLDFSATHGVLQAGESAEVTVTLDPSQAQDGNLSETFVIAGVSVTAALPASAPQPSPAGTPAGSPAPVPSDVPTAPPSGSG